MNHVTGKQDTVCLRCNLRKIIHDLLIVRTAIYIPKNQDYINSSIILVLNVGTLYHSLSDMLSQLKNQAPIKQNF